MGAKVTVQESPWDCDLLVAMNHERKPFDDRRVRRALTLALDRHEGAQALSRIAIVKAVAGVQVPGTPFATPPAELERLGGDGRDIDKGGGEGPRLLRGAGGPDGVAVPVSDRVLDELYARQSRAVDPEERKRLVREFEKRLLDEEAHYLYTLQWHRIVPHSARVRGWTITPSHFLNQQLDTVWLSE